MAKGNAGDYEVGFGKPPAQRRFQRGQSGNPHGRPRGSKNFATLMDRALDEQVTIKQGGSRRKISKREAMVKQLANKAASGDHKSIQLLVALLQHLEARQPPGDDATNHFEVADEAVIEGMLERFKTTAAAGAMAVSKTLLTAEEYRVFLRADFSAFIERCFHQLNPQTQFLRNWHIEVMAAKLEACRQGKIRRLIINVPPRSLKSICASVALPAWILGHQPAGQILCVSYAQDLADKLARDCRSVMSSSWYQSLFRARLSSQKQSVQEFVTTAGGYRLATSVGGVLTGRGADCIIIDDPIKPSEALSDSVRRAANDWYDHTLYSRLNDKRSGCIIIIMQRLHEDDLVGHVLEREGWEIVSFPAIAEADEEYVWDTLYGQRRGARREGEPLHPAREPLAVLGTIRATLGEYNFASQYQQVPAPLEGGLVKAAWFKNYTEGDLPEHYDQVVQSWDTANKLSEFADYSVCTTWGLKDKRLYLLHVLHKKLNYPELKRAACEQAAMHQATVILIEDKASGTQLIQELIYEGLHTVKAIKPEGDKIMRLNAQTATIENGFVYLPRVASWLADYLHELTTFPAAKYDDQADSTSQALAWIKQSGAEPGS